jgi:hypothetical protein
MTNPQLCMNCGERPAEPGKATVPLCSVCKNMAQGKERGVKMAPKTPKSGKKLAAVR